MDEEYIVLKLSIGTSLSELPTVIGKFTSIVEFNLSTNSISTLPWSIFYLQHLEELNLSNNLIVSNIVLFTDLYTKKGIKIILTNIFSLYQCMLCKYKD